MKPITRDNVSKALDPARKYINSPVLMATGLGLAGAGLGIGLWENIIETGGSLGRYPIRKLTGMSDAEYSQAVRDLASDDRYRWLVPGAIGALLGGSYLNLKHNQNQVGKGIHNWAPKTASLQKAADELWSYGGYVPKLPEDQIVNARAARAMFTNDPFIQQNPYLKNTGLSIINHAVNTAGYANPTIGNIYDSTAEKMKSKLSWAGVTDIAANTMLANATASLFANALGAVVPLSDTAKQNIIDGGTWYTAVKSILT